MTQTRPPGASLFRKHIGFHILCLSIIVKCQMSAKEKTKYIPKVLIQMNIPRMSYVGFINIVGNTKRIYDREHKEHLLNRGIQHDKRRSLTIRDRIIRKSI